MQVHTTFVRLTEKDAASGLGVVCGLGVAAHISTPGLYNVIYVYMQKMQVVKEPTLCF